MSNFKILILALCLCLVSCFPMDSPNTVDELQTIIHDSCEYLTYEGSYALTHKGNCTFCTQRREESDQALTTRAIWFKLVNMHEVIDPSMKGTLNIPYLRGSQSKLLDHE